MSRLFDDMVHFIFLFFTCNCSGADDDEQSVKFWNVEEGTLIRSLNKLGESPYSVRYMAADSLVLVEYTDCFKAVRVSGEMVYTLDKETLYRVAGKDKTILALFTDEYATLYDTYTGKRKCRVKQKKRSRKYIIDDPDENHIHGTYAVRSFFLLIPDFNEATN